ncbi:Voltage gated chloride channel domain-containing protein [Rhodotorula toruloides ATCC 204091]|uniref:Uncharacterized protein n=1 Tax=Rhodotorula toruloides TaxID=5286 RepID=A0A2T0AF92_RHOTO|nr:Voltage gated chloride channel domain-containing protein [Rhodotorula toruloides ATCC 204091]KAK4333882.1 Voltage gated chloride channel domain-containing protein [Rhodotorula toruloides]PRQ76654.1 hypothetical protein AAT19DRAFT_12072 [Rhodotorula toruloides]
MASLLHDAILATLFLSVFLLPAYFFLPTFLRPLIESSRALAKSLAFVLLAALLFLLVLVAALVGEKAYRRWVLGVRPPSEAERVGVVGPDASPEERRRAKRFSRESKMDAVAEKVIDKLEASSVGKLLRRKGKGRSSRSGDVELKDLRGSAAATTARRRTPPPPPPLPPRA